jgi:hypothetical protein
MSEGPLIVQSGRTVLLEVAHPLAEDARHDLAVFAELARAPDSADMLATLETYSKFPAAADRPSDAGLLSRLNRGHAGSSNKNS